MATAQDEIKSLKADLKEIKELMAENAKTVSSIGEKQANMTKEDLGRAAAKAGDNVRAFVKRKGDQLNDARDACETTIKNRPFASTAIAFAGGMLIASLLSRK